jgi:ABC-type lipopolysaccharide export system ATPase subunit
VLEHGHVAQEGEAKALASDDRIRKIYLGIG